MKLFFLIMSAGLFLELQRKSSSHKHAIPDLRPVFADGLLLLFFSAVMVCVYQILFRFLPAQDPHEYLAVLLLPFFLISRALHKPNGFMIILAVISVFVLQQSASLTESLIYLLCISAGSLAFRLSLQSVEWRSLFSAIPERFRGLPALLLIASLCALAFAIFPIAFQT